MKITDLKIFDNFLSEKYLNHLKECIIWGEVIDWKINLSSKGEKTNLKDKIFDTQCVCELIKTPYFVSPHTQLLCPFIDIIPWVYRAKINVTFPSEKDTYTLGIHTDNPFLDGKHNYYSGVFYLNDSDGYTEIYNPKDKSISPKPQKIECKENRLIVFPGNYSHSGTTPTNVKARYIINFVFFGDIFPENIRKAEQSYVDRFLENG